MTDNYTINDAFHDGFECGLLYALRYAETVGDIHMTTDDASRLAEHLGAFKSWRTEEEWHTFVLGNINSRE